MVCSTYAYRSASIEVYGTISCCPTFRMAQDRAYQVPSQFGRTTLFNFIYHSFQVKKKLPPPASSLRGVPPLNKGVALQKDGNLSGDTCRTRLSWCAIIYVGRIEYGNETMFIHRRPQIGDQEFPLHQPGDSQHFTLTPKLAENFVLIGISIEFGN